MVIGTRFTSLRARVEVTMPPAESGAVLSDYYLTYDTPKGRRYAYPMPKVLGKPGFPPLTTAAVVWTNATRGDVQAYGNKWLISELPLGEVLASWQPSDRPGPWVKRSAAPADPLALAAWEKAPDSPTEEALDHYGDYWGCDEDECCLRCQFHRAIYERTSITPPVESRVFDFTGWEELPGYSRGRW
jgi:hypothetical protein